MNSHSGAHIIGPKTYVTVLFILFVFTAITVLVAGFDFGSLNVVIALSVATAKASLVALYFMHLRHDKPMNGIIFLSGLVFLGIFLIFCYIDVQSRDDVRPSIARPAAPARK